MEPYGFGVMVLMENLELMIQSIDQLQSLHLLEERIGNRLVQEIRILQQLNRMELYGLGVLDL